MARARPCVAVFPIARRLLALLKPVLRELLRVYALNDSQLVCRRKLYHMALAPLRLGDLA